MSQEWIWLGASTVMLIGYWIGVSLEGARWRSVTHAGDDSSDSPSSGLVESRGDVYRVSLVVKSWNDHR